MRKINVFFTYEPHLNYILPTDGESAVENRLSRNRKRQIKSSLFFIVKYKGEVVGGNVCPVFANRTVYEW